MKRIALLIGNSDGLEGVKKDLVNWTRFLYSLEGGAWNSSEIITLMNPRKEELCSKIEDIRGEYDFAIVVFSGHGIQRISAGFPQNVIDVRRCHNIRFFPVENKGLFLAVVNGQRKSHAHTQFFHVLRQKRINRHGKQ